MDRRFFHRLGASRLDRTICSSAGMVGMTAGAGRALRHRARAVPPLQADPRLGRQHSRHQRAPVAVHHGGAAQRREAVHHRPEPQSHRRGQRPALLHQSRQRHGAGAGHDARDHRREPARRRLRRALHRRLRRSCASACAPGRRSAPRNSPASRPRTSCTGARVRHHAAGGDPPELRRAAQRARRHGGAHHRAAAGADRVVEGRGRRPAALHFAGVPVEPRRAGARRPAADVARPRGAHRQHVASWGRR